MKILTAEEMGAADQRSVQAGVPIATLMENAGAAVARFCVRRFGVDEERERPVVVLCGKGHNGGDGMVAARYLAEAGCEVRVVLLGSWRDLKREMGMVWAEAKHWVSEVVEVADEEMLREALKDALYVVDAVVGTGFKPPLRGLAAVARDILAEMTVPVVAVDLPSGWDADSMAEKAEGAFRADAVVTFAAPKLAHVFGHLTAGKTFGPVVVAGIGTPEEAIASATGLTWTGRRRRLRRGQGRSMGTRAAGACADRGWGVWEGRRAGDGVAGGDARGCWTGDGGGAAGDFVAGGGGCAGADAGTARGSRFQVQGSRWGVGMWWAGFGAVGGGGAADAAEGHDGGGDWAGVGSGGEQRRSLCGRLWSGFRCPW